MNKLYELKFAEMKDLESWINMIEIVKDNFPGLDSKNGMHSYRKTVEKNIKRETALCVKEKKKVVGVLIFSYTSSCLSCMTVHPEHRRNGIASEMIKKMIEQFPKDQDIEVTTFREDDKLGEAPRALYKKFGFVEGKLIIEFNYPHQRFILKRLNI